MVQNIEEAMTIKDLIALTEFYRREADRKRAVLTSQAKLFGREINSIEIERAGHEDDMLAEAHVMILKAISERALKKRGDVAKTVQMKILYPETAEEVVAPVLGPKAPVTPEIKDPETKKVAQEMIDNSDIEDSIYEAVSLADGKQNNAHWETARSKSLHFYRGTDALSTNPTEKEVDDFIRTIVNKVRTRMEAKFQAEGLFERTAVPLDSLNAIQKAQYIKDGKFNMAILMGNANASTEDRMKLTAIHEFTKGNEAKAVAIIRTCYSNKNWDDVIAREFLYTLMKKNPHKELETVVRAILKENKIKKGDAKKGVKMCRNIIALYFGKKYTIQIGNTKMTPEHVRDNQLIDRIINRTLKNI